MKALLVGNRNPKIDSIAAAQLYPFFDHRRQLKQLLDLTFQHVQAVTLAEIAAACRGADADVLIIRPSWQEEADRVLQVMQEIRSEHANKIILFIDPWDQESSRFFAVLPYVDWFLKYQRLKQVSEYHKEYVGGTIITDYLAKQHNFDIGDWHVGSPVPIGYEHRIVTAWNVTVIEKFQKALRKPTWPRRAPVKDIDIFCRVTVGSIQKQEWYGQYRLQAVNALKPLEQDYKLAMSAEFDEARFISRRQYQSDLRRSRIVFSPFGWGATTWRDYEAVCHDCLLIKPRMDRIDSKPNIYVPGITYVPVQWDFADLAETCRYYLERPKEAQAIVDNARRAYEGYFRYNEFVQTLKPLLQRNRVNSVNQVNQTELRLVPESLAAASLEGLSVSN